MQSRSVRYGRAFVRRAAQAVLAAAAFAGAPAALAAVGSTTAAEGSANRVPPLILAAAPAEPAKAGKGEIRADLLYHNYCSVCHGDRGDGRSRARGSLVPPPKDFTSPQAIAELTRERMIAFTASGKPGTAMVGWSTQLSQREIEAVVDYVLNTFMKPRTTASFARGKSIYAQACIVCHGEFGQGAPAGAHGTVPPRNFASPQARAELSPEKMIAAVTQGRPGTPMGSYANQLSREDIAAVVDFIRVSFMAASPADASGTSAHRGRAGADAPAVPAFPGAVTPANGAAKPGGTAAPASASAPTPAPVGADMSLPFPNKLVGNAARGRKFYDANCATCHGVKGDAQGPRAYFIRPVPRNFLTAESRAVFNRPALFAGVSAGRLGSEMPAWSKVLSEQEIADVAEYVFQSFIVARAGGSKAASAKPSK